MTNSPESSVLQHIQQELSLLEKERLGLDDSTLSYLYAEAFKKRGITVVHGKPTMDNARIIKTADEIELMRITCANSEKAFAAIGLKALYEEGDDHTEDLV